MKPIYPLITCICITNHRTVLLKKAIGYFKAQDYPNKELLISYPEKDKMTKHIIEKIIREDSVGIIKLERQNELSLGDARNEAISSANGEYICTWDDDDWYHPGRLSYQFNSLQGLKYNYQASVLNQLLLYDRSNEKAYLSFLYPWENTLLCKRDFFTTNQYTSKDQGEDSNIVDILDADKLLLHLRDVPFLYIYIYHGGNTWGYHHFKSFIKRSQLLDEDTTQHIRLQINN